jgi:hypothetical protein
VQALELDIDAGVRRHAVHSGQGHGVVGGELAVQVRRGVQHDAGAHQIVQIGRRLGGVDRIVRTAGDLRALDLGVPIGALHQADHQAALGRAGQFGQASDHLGRALLIGLHGQAQALPLAQLGFAGQPLEQLQRQGQAIGLFGVHAEVDVVAGGDDRQALDAGIQLRPHAILVHRLIARRQGRQLDRDAVAGLGTARFRPVLARLADGVDGVGVDALVAFGVGGGARALAQHVEAAQPAVAVGPLEGAADVAAQHELLAHHAHGGGHGLADHGLADASSHALEEAGQVALGVLIHVHQPAGQHQAPGRGVDEQAVGLTQMFGPVGRADLFGDQAVAGVLVGGAQQGLGQAHERQALAGAQRELL